MHSKITESFSQDKRMTNENKINKHDYNLKEAQTTAGINEKKKSSILPDKTKSKGYKNIFF